MNISLPRYPLAHLPTPLEPLPRLSRALGGPNLFIKRDDQTGLAGGGNKARKLEFLLAEALAQQADTLVTLGAIQSNHCRQTAAAAARAGLACILILGGQPPAGPASGNLLLDQLLGAEVRWAGEHPREAVMAEAIAEARAAGRRPYAIPLGGSSALGAAGYVLALAELKAQMDARSLAFDRIVVASSSGGTQAGLAAGAALAGFGGQVLGISIDSQAEPLRAAAARLAVETSALAGRPRAFQPDDISVDAGYLGGGYGVLGNAEREAIALFAQEEGIILDPVYTGRAAAGLLDLIRRGAIAKGERILFWHTGGQPALFVDSYASHWQS